MRGAPDGTLAVMADAWVSIVLRTVSVISRGRTESRTVTLISQGRTESRTVTLISQGRTESRGSEIQHMRLSYRGWVTLTYIKFGIVKSYEYTNKQEKGNKTEKLKLNVIHKASFFHESKEIFFIYTFS